MRNRRLFSGAPAAAGIAQRDEVFRLLRSNLLVAMADLERPTVLVTSALADEGKTTTCANLATSLSQAGLRVVAVDVDFRHPNLHAHFGADNTKGLSDVLLDRTELDSVLQYCPTGTDGQGLYLVATGSPVTNPTELLGSTRMSRLLDSLARQADIVVLDTPPVLPVADALVLGRMVAGAIMVVAARSTPITAVQHAKDALTRNQTRLLGVVLNRLEPREIGDTIYGYPAPLEEAGA